MCECCVNKKDLGCFESCSMIVTGIFALLTGDYTIHFAWLGVNHTIAVALTAGDPIDFSSDCFNESATQTFLIKDPLGATVILTELGIDYDCFTIRTVPTIPC